MAGKDMTITSFFPFNFKPDLINHLQIDFNRRHKGRLKKTGDHGIVLEVLHYVRRLPIQE